MPEHRVALELPPELRQIAVCQDAPIQDNSLCPGDPTMGSRTKQSQEVHKSLNAIWVHPHINKTPTQPQFFLIRHSCLGPRPQIAYLEVAGSKFCPRYYWKAPETGLFVLSAVIGKANLCLLRLVCYLSVRVEMPFGLPEPVRSAAQRSPNAGALPRLDADYGAPRFGFRVDACGLRKNSQSSTSTGRCGTAAHGE